MPVTDSSNTEAWRPGRVLLALKDGRQQEVGGHLHGTLAVHQDVTVPSLWALTHGPSGLLLCLLPRMEDAQRIGRHLWANARAAFSQCSAASIKARCPAWVKPWLVACTGKGGWVNPEEYASAKEEK